MKAAPTWDIPQNLNELIDADEAGMWDDTRWSPIVLTVMKGTSYASRDIPLAWQVEFEPFGPKFEMPNRKIIALGLEPDGYGWATLIKSIVEKYHPEIAPALQFGDTEESTCVIWVESEGDCHQLIQIVWGLIHAG